MLDSDTYKIDKKQDFGFDPSLDGMFGRTRLGSRLGHDPFANFGTRKRCGKDPHAATAADGFSHYFDDDPEFGFPEFGSLGRRRAGAGAAGLDRADDDDFFNRLPSEFRQYMPEHFGQRRGPQMQHHMPPQHAPQYESQSGPVYYAAAPNATPAGAAQTPSKKLCDAAIQTEDPSNAGRTEVDGHQASAAAAEQQLNQHGLRNTVDMGVKSMPEAQDMQGSRAHSAPPPEQAANGRHRTPPPQAAGAQYEQAPQYETTYYMPRPQKQQTPPAAPQTPGGTYIRTIPIFVEGRSEPIINDHKEIPNQYQVPSQAATPPTGRAQPQQRPTPLNTQQQTQQEEVLTQAGVPPQTPHTLDSIDKIQNIQRDVLDLMTKVDKFQGTRQDKEYAYLDEMLTRNLLKLDTIDTNGKDSIRLARKEAIKCIQASINVLEAKAEENLRRQKEQASQGGAQAQSAAESQTATAEKGDENVQTKEMPEAQAPEEEAQAITANSQEPIPLPAPEHLQTSSEATEQQKQEAMEQDEANLKKAEEGAGAEVAENAEANNNKKE